jgi:hypothetical protein
VPQVKLYGTDKKYVWYTGEDGTMFQYDVAKKEWRKQVSSYHNNVFTGKSWDKVSLAESRKLDSLVRPANFNKVLFATYLKLAQGNRTFNAYATDSTVSPAHISRLTRQLIETAPAQDTLLQLSAVAQNGVTFNDLFKASRF